METNEDYQDVYTANGTQDTFALTFSFETNAVTGLPKGIKVQLTESLGNGEYADPEELVEGVGYTLQVGAVQLTSVPPSQSIVIPYRAESLDQSRDFPGYSQEVENAFDKIHRILIDFSGKLNRILRLDRAEAEQELVLPSAAIRANHYLYFDETGALSVRVGPVPKTYDPEYPFQTGELTQYSGIFWKSLIDNNTGTTPGTDDSKWEPMPFELSYRSDKEYDINALAIYNGVIYASKANANKGNQPDASPTWWKTASAMTDAQTLNGASIDTDEKLIAKSDSLLVSQKAVRAFSAWGNAQIARGITGLAFKTWSLKNAGAVDNTWNDAHWIGYPINYTGRIIIVGSNVGVTTSGPIAYSDDDGETWTDASGMTGGSSYIYNSICYSPSLAIYCVVGADGGIGEYIATSTDGTSWTIQTGPASTNWKSVFWCPELSIFCAVASSGFGTRAMTSTDGIVWSLRSTPADINWESVCWSPELGLFCAVASSGTGSRVMTSPNGETWTLRSTPADNNWESVCWSPELGLFCAVATSGTNNRVMTSPDGITWTLQTSAENYSWKTVRWLPELGCLLAISTSSNAGTLMVSFNGIDWELRFAVSGTSYWKTFTFNPLRDMVCAAGYGGSNRVMVSR